MVFKYFMQIGKREDKFPFHVILFMKRYMFEFLMESREKKYIVRNFIGFLVSILPDVLNVDTTR